MAPGPTNGAPPSAEEAAAIAAAIERFRSELAPAPTAVAGTSISSWARAALLEGVGRRPGPTDAWPDPEPWGRRS